MALQTSKQANKQTSVHGCTVRKEAPPFYLSIMQMKGETQKDAQSAAVTSHAASSTGLGALLSSQEVWGDIAEDDR